MLRGVFGAYAVGIIAVMVDALLRSRFDPLAAITVLFLVSAGAALAVYALIKTDRGAERQE